MNQLDYYYDGPYLVFRESYHLKRGSCCGQGCRHCPFDPKGIEGNCSVSGKFRQPD